MHIKEWRFLYEWQNKTFTFLSASASNFSSRTRSSGTSVPHVASLFSSSGAGSSVQVHEKNSRLINWMLNMIKQKCQTRKETIMTINKVKGRRYRCNGGVVYVSVRTCNSLLTGNISFHKITCSLSSVNTSSTCAVAIAYCLLAALIAPLVILPPWPPNSSVVVNVNIFFILAPRKCCLLLEASEKINLSS